MINGFFTYKEIKWTHLITFIFSLRRRTLKEIVSYTFVWFFFYNKIYSIYLKNEIFVKAKDISQSMIVRWSYDQ